MGKKKKEHVTFDRMADNRIRKNKMALIFKSDFKSSKQKLSDKFIIKLKKK